MITNNNNINTNYNKAFCQADEKEKDVVKMTNDAKKTNISGEVFNENRYNEIFGYPSDNEEASKVLENDYIEDLKEERIREDGPSRLFELKVWCETLEDQIKDVESLLNSLYKCVYDDTFCRFHVIISYIAGCIIKTYDVYTGIDKHLNDALMILNYRYCFASTEKEAERKAFYKPRVINACKRLLKALKSEFDAVKTAYFLEDVKVNGGVINE